MKLRGRERARPVCLSVSDHLCARRLTPPPRACARGPADAQSESSTGTTCTDVDNNGRITIPEGQTEIGDSAFSGCAALRAVLFPATLESIGSSSFMGCTSLESVDLSATVLTAIGSHGFFGCTALRNISFPATLESIGYSIGRSAFSNSTCCWTSFSNPVLCGSSTNVLSAFSNSTCCRTFVSNTGLCASSTTVPPSISPSAAPAANVSPSPSSASSTSVSPSMSPSAAPAANPDASNLQAQDSANVLVPVAVFAVLAVVAGIVATGGCRSCPNRALLRQIREMEAKLMAQAKAAFYQSYQARLLVEPDVVARFEQVSLTPPSHTIGICVHCPKNTSKKPTLTCSCLVMIKPTLTCSCLVMIKIVHSPKLRQPFA